MASKKEEDFFSGKTTGIAASAHLSIRQYHPSKHPADNPQLHAILMKLDGYGLADQEKRMLVLTDQNNRTYALRYLAQHLDLIHIVDLVQSLHVMMMRQIADFGNGHFDGFQWPWQWGPEPPKVKLISLPHLTEGEWGNPRAEKESPVAESELYGGPTYGEIREVMVKHEIKEVLMPEYPLIRCACGKEFEGADAEVKYNKHIRARVKELMGEG
jgi:hypothetical protein